MEKTILVDASLDPAVRERIESKITTELRSVVSRIGKLRVVLRQNSTIIECGITATTSKGKKLEFSTMNADYDVAIADAIARLRREAIRVYQRVGSI